jgi:hypothetical protein
MLDFNIFAGFKNDENAKGCRHKALTQQSIAEVAAGR